MKTDQVHPDLGAILAELGQAGRDLAAMGASEGSAGNMSVYLSRVSEPQSLFPEVEVIKLPLPVPGLGGGAFLVSGSGTRLRDLADQPLHNLGLLLVEPGGETAVLYTHPQKAFKRLTSEFNSHLAVHADQIARSGLKFHAILHAQPYHLTYLSHIPGYADEVYLNRHILRWQPETILQFCEGIGVIPFAVPGSPEMMRGNLEAMRAHRLVIWAKHGMMVRSDVSVQKAYDLIEYAEAAARYEYLNLAAGEPAAGLTPEEIRSICALWKVEQNIF